MHSEAPDYPVRVRGDLDPELSRWRWLIKWILAIPHHIVLLFLFIAYMVVTLVAFVAILVTGKYPRQLFDFNVGVMRWRWRVSFYALSALATDRYPPFSLRPNSEYPADLDIDYPQHLSRVLVLIKWWLLALPHYLLLAMLFNGGWEFLGADEAGLSLHVMLPLMVIMLPIAMVALLFTGRYPQGLYDFVIGINRWSIRVRAYVWLMCDEYPPFRLDMRQRDSEPAAGSEPA